MTLKEKSVGSARPPANGRAHTTQTLAGHAPGEGQADGPLLDRQHTAAQEALARDALSNARHLSRLIQACLPAIPADGAMPGVKEDAGTIERRAFARDCIERAAAENLAFVEELARLARPSGPPVGLAHAARIGSQIASDLHAVVAMLDDIAQEGAEAYEEAMVRLTGAAAVIQRAGAMADSIATSDPAGCGPVVGGPRQWLYPPAVLQAMDAMQRGAA